MTITPARLAALQAQRATAGTDAAIAALQATVARQSRLDRAFRDGREVAQQQLTYLAMRHVVAAGGGLRITDPGMTFGVRDALKGLDAIGRQRFADGVANVLAEIDGAQT